MEDHAEVFRPFRRLRVQFLGAIAFIYSTKNVLIKSDRGCSSKPFDETIALNPDSQCALPVTKIGRFLRSPLLEKPGFLQFEHNSLPVFSKTVKFSNANITQNLSLIL